MKLMGGGTGGPCPRFCTRLPPRVELGRRPLGEGGGGGIGGGVQGGWHRDGYLANRVPPLTGSVSTQISSKWP